jgi:hypothetical protein
MSSKEVRRQTWIARLTAYKQSGQTMKVWCNAQGVTLDQLKYWLRKLKSEDGGSESPPAASFVPLVLSESSHAPTSASLRLHVGDVHIDVNVGFDPRLLRDVVAALRTPC